MSTDRDFEQDEMIRRNAEDIRLNREAIERQTAALEQIRDHYFPKKTFWKRSCDCFLKTVGAVTVAAGILEAADWLWNTHEAERMAAESADVAKRLFFQENDAESAVDFLEKAVELDGGSIRYRTALAQVKGFAAIADLFELGRPLTDGERSRLDRILASAVYLREIAPDEAMPCVLGARVRMLRGEKEASLAEIKRAVALEPDNVQAHVSSCALHFTAGDVPTARRQLAEAERLNPDFPLVLYWKAFVAFTVDRDLNTARAVVDDLLRRMPKMATVHLLKGLILKKTDPALARASFVKALELSPKLTRAMVPLAETYLQDGNVTLARLWLDRALEKDPNAMAALVARARLFVKAGDGKAAAADLTKAISLAPFRADLYGERAAIRKAMGDEAGAADDLKVARALGAS